MLESMHSLNIFKELLFSDNLIEIENDQVCLNNIYENYILTYYQNEFD